VNLIADGESSRMSGSTQIAVALGLLLTAASLIIIVLTVKQHQRKYQQYQLHSGKYCNFTLFS
jgi:hypothetical protein